MTEHTSDLIEAAKRRIESLETTVADQHNRVSRRDALITARDARINELEHQTSKQKETNRRLNDDLAIMRKDRDGLVKALHSMADAREDNGEGDVAEEIDEIISVFNLPGRKKHYELIFTVPMQYRVEGDFKDADAFRQAFADGQIEWSEGDYEEIEDGSEPRIVVVAELDS